MTRVMFGTDKNGRVWRRLYGSDAGLIKRLEELEAQNLWLQRENVELLAKLEEAKWTHQS